MRGFILPVLVAVVAAIFHVAVMPFFFTTKEVGILLPCLVLIVMGLRFSRAVTFAVVAGAVLDSYALVRPSFFLLRLLLLAGLTYVIFSRSLTNRSVYTAMVLAGIASVVDAVLSFLITRIQGVPVLLAWSSRGVLVSLCLHIVLAFIGFLLVMSFPRRRTFSSSWYG